MVSGNPTRAINLAGMMLAAMLICSCSGTPIDLPIFDPSPTPTASNTPTPLPLPTATSTPTPTATPTPLPTPMVIVVSVKIPGSLNLLAMPTANAEIVGVLPPGVFVPVVDMLLDGQWVKVGENPSGWVPSNAIALTGEVLFSDQTATQRQPLVQSDSAVYVRSGPGVKNRVVGTLKAGQIARVTERDEKGAWLHVQFGEIDGWLSAQTVIESGGVSTPTPEATNTVTR